GCAVWRCPRECLLVAELPETPEREVGDRIRREHHVAGELRTDRARVDLVLGLAQHVAEAEALDDGPRAQVVGGAAGLVERARALAFACRAEGAGFVPAEAAREVAAAARERA